MAKYLYGKKAAKTNRWGRRFTGKRLRFLARR
jgi:hypothetical protein